MFKKHYPSIGCNGFTLIELSIVLVIIGLIVGGILAGRDLIEAAAVRAQITQIERYNTASRTFRNKYSELPGDMLYTNAGTFGFVTNGCWGGQGVRDGNGLIEGWQGITPAMDQFLGEDGLFWEDLSTAGLIDGTFPNSGATARDCTHPYPQITLTPGLNYVGDFIPAGKIGYGTFVYIYPYNSVNYYGLSVVTGTAAGTCWNMISNPGIPVVDAYNIDKKIDDGLPTTGSVTVNYLTYTGNNAVLQAPNAASPSAATCFDTTSNQYSTSIQGGSNLNCALSFRLQ